MCLLYTLSDSSTSTLNDSCLSVLMVICIVSVYWYGMVELSIPEMFVGAGFDVRVVVFVREKKVFDERRNRK